MLDVAKYDNNNDEITIHDFNLFYRIVNKTIHKDGTYYCSD